MIKSDTINQSDKKNIIITKATVRAADRLGLTGVLLSNIIGVSEANISRMRNGKYIIPENSKVSELSILLLRVFRSLDAIVDGDENTTKSWMKNVNTALGDAPINKIVTVQGLIDVLTYLDARRATI
jgi:hypothetical protein